MIFHLPGVWAVALVFVVWLVIHLGVSILVARRKPDAFDPEAWLYRGRSWEREGKIYKALLGIRKWKRVLPDGAAVFKRGFRKKHLRNQDTVYIHRFIIETCRAELAHWVIFFFAFSFFIWNDWWVGMIMVAYALITNMPCIVAQRYNRARLRRFDRRCAERTLSQQTERRT